MCYCAATAHHTGGGHTDIVVPKSYGNGLPNWHGFGYGSIPAGANSSQLAMSDYNVYLWGPLNTRDFW